MQPGQLPPCRHHELLLGVQHDYHSSSKRLHGLGIMGAVSTLVPTLLPNRDLFTVIGAGSSDHPGLHLPCCGPPVQNVADCGEGGDPSSSEDGYASASLDGAGSQGEGGSANGGRAWDESGVPVDYTFKVTPGIHPTEAICPDLVCEGPLLSR